MEFFANTVSCPVAATIDVPIVFWLHQYFGFCQKSEIAGVLVGLILSDLHLVPLSKGVAYSVRKGSGKLISFSLHVVAANWSSFKVRPF